MTIARCRAARPGNGESISRHASGLRVIAARCSIRDAISGDVQPGQPGERDRLRATLRGPSRSRQAEHRPRLRLPAGRQRQLRRRPGTGRKAGGHLPGRPADGRPTTAGSWPAPWTTCSPRASASTWTWAPGCPPPRPCMRSSAATTAPPPWSYVDNDPVVISHLRALAASGDDHVAAVAADLS